MAQVSMPMTSISQAAMSMSQLPTLAPAPAPHQQHLQQMHQGAQQQQPATMQQPGSNAITLPPQQLGQPQFLIQQPTMQAAQQYATFPQFAYTNQQGQIVLQPAAHFTTLQGGHNQAAGQPQVILTGAAFPPQQQPQQPGQQQPQQQPQGGKQAGGGVPQTQMMTAGQPTMAKSVSSVASSMPANYTITSTGQLQQLCGPGIAGSPQTFMIANPMLGPTAIPGAVSMAGPNGQTQTIHTSMAAQVQIKDGKVQQGQPQVGPGHAQAQPSAALMQATGPQQAMAIAGQPTSQHAGPQFVIPPNGMTYMQAGPNQQQIIQNGQLIFRAPGQNDQQLMFTQGPVQGQAPHTSQVGQVAQQPHQAQVQMQQTATLVAPPGAQQMQPPTMQMNGQMVRQPSALPNGGAPPGKTAISRAIAPLLPNSVTQSTARMSFAQGGMNQSSPKSKQKMSPRGGANTGARQPGPKGGNVKMLPRPPAGVTANNVVGSPSPAISGSPGPQVYLPQSVAMTRPPMPPTPMMAPAAVLGTPIAGPPTLTPVMTSGVEGGAVVVASVQQPVPMQGTVVATMSQPALPTSQVMPMQQTAISSATMSSHLSKLVPVSATMANNYGGTVVTSKPPPGVVPSTTLDMPPTLTKEIITPPAVATSTAVGMPNLIQPAVTAAVKTVDETEAGGDSATLNGTGPGGTTPKAVVKPQVLTHFIDGHIIKESSQPFPVSPVKGTIRKKADKQEDSKTVNGQAPAVKRGPGRPPGSKSGQSLHNKNNSNAAAAQQSLSGAAVGEPTEKKAKLDMQYQEVGRPTPTVANGSYQQQIPQQQQPAAPAPQQPQANPPQSAVNTVLAAPAPAAVAPPPPPPPQAAAPVAQAAPTTPSAPAVSGLPSCLIGTNPLKWKVNEVCDFVASLPGCAEYVDEFAQQEIDGQALMLLKADHLMSAMSIKLGPALKICSHITQIREEMNKA